MIDTLYREEILEHYKCPLNFGRLSSFDASSRQLNPFCGDEIAMFIKYDSFISQSVATKTPRRSISKIGFIGKGCAISIASASILTDFAMGKAKKELTKFREEDMLSLLGVEISETRKKCALLGLAVLRDCLNHNY